MQVYTTTPSVCILSSPSTNTASVSIFETMVRVFESFFAEVWSISILGFLVMSERDSTKEK